MKKNNYFADDGDNQNSLEENFKINYDAFDALNEKNNSEESESKQTSKIDIYEASFDESVSFFSWFILIVVFSILSSLGIYGDAISLVILGIIGFYANTKRNLKNFARAMLLINIIVLAIGLILGG